MLKLVNSLLIVATLIGPSLSAQAQETSPQSSVSVDAVNIQNTRDELASLKGQLVQAQKLKTRYLVIGLTTAALDVVALEAGSGAINFMSTVLSGSAQPSPLWFATVKDLFMPVIIGTAAYSGYNDYKWYHVRHSEIPVLIKQFNDLNAELDAAQRAQAALQN